MEDGPKAMSVPRASPQCGQCGRGVTTEWHEHVFRYGVAGSAVEIRANLPFRRCKACDFDFLDEEGQRLKHEALCRHFGLLTPREIVSIRHWHGMTRATFAELTGFGTASLGRWETGTLLQTQANDRYLRLLAEPDGLDRLRAVIGLDSVALGRNETARHTGVMLRRFRQLRVTKEVRERQQGFRLRKVA